MSTEKHAPEIEDIFTSVREQPEPGTVPLPDPDAVPAERTMDMGKDHSLFDHSAETSLREARDRELGIHVPRPPDTIPAPVQNPAMLVESVGADARAKAEAAFQDTIDEVSVQVSEEDKAAFLRAALHDTEVVFDVELEGVDMTVSVAMPSEAFTATAQMVTKAWSEAGHIDLTSTMQFLVAFQQVHLWWQIRAVNGEPVSWAWDTDRLGEATIPRLRKFMADYDNLAPVVNMGSLRYRLLMRASMIAEIKYKLCLQSLHDRSFFTGAATA